MCHIKPVRTEAEYEAALARIYALWDAEPGTPEGAELELLVDLVELYETRHIPMSDLEVAAANKFHLEQQGWTVQRLNAPPPDDTVSIDDVLKGRQPIPIAWALALLKAAARPEGDYDAALSRIYAIRDAKPGTPEGAELELLVDQVELYEAEYYPIGKPSLADAVAFQMEQRGLTVPQLNALLGGQADVGALLAGRQPLTLALATALHERLGISEAVLLKSAELREQPGVSESILPKGAETRI